MQKAKLQKQQHELQENLLRDLSSNSDILHDANLLASLNKTRETNTTISKALEAAHVIERANSEACAKYEPSAKRAAVLALAVKRLSARWPLVVLPVDAVLETFVEAVRKAVSYLFTKYKALGRGVSGLRLDPSADVVKAKQISDYTWGWMNQYRSS